MVFLIGLLIVLVLVWLFKNLYLKALTKHGTGKKGIEGRRLLLVIAHPDDECLFFGPLILSFLSVAGRTLHILCLSHGNFRGEGPVRKNELWAAAGTLGVQAASITLIKHDHLPDDPRRFWPVELLTKTVLSHVHTYSIDTVVTFDEGGVSGHSNHRAINRAVSELCRRGDLPPSCRVFELESVNVFRKYFLYYIDLPLALIGDFIALANPDQQRIIWQAMECHVSQLVWFRRLYCTFSRYMALNTFRQLPVTSRRKREKDK